MRSRLAIIIVALTSVIIIALQSGWPAVTAQDKEKPREKWEYKVVQQGTLDAHGAEGWEVAAVTGGQPYIESFRSQPQGGGVILTQNTVRYAPTIYHLKRRK